MTARGPCARRAGATRARRSHRDSPRWCRKSSRAHESARGLLHDDQHFAGVGGDLGRAAGAGQAHLGVGVLANDRGVEIAEAIDLRRSEKAEVDAPALQVVREHLRQRNHARSQSPPVRHRRSTAAAPSGGCPRYLTRRSAPESRGVGALGRGCRRHSAGRCRRNTPRRCAVAVRPRYGHHLIRRCRRGRSCGHPEPAQQLRMVRHAEHILLASTLKCRDRGRSHPTRHRSDCRVRSNPPHRRGARRRARCSPR